MALLEKWRASRDLDKFRSEFDDLLERFGFDRNWFSRWPFDLGLFSERESAPLRPAIESYVEGDKFIVRTDLPGIDPKNIDIKVVGDMLSITGSREEKRESEKTDHHFRSEIRYGAFERSLPLPEGIKAEDLKAIYRDGVLELSAPMPKEAAPKKVKVQVEGATAPAEKKA